MEYVWVSFSWVGFNDLVHKLCDFKMCNFTILLSNFRVKFSWEEKGFEIFVVVLRQWLEEGALDPNKLFTIHQRLSFHANFPGLIFWGKVHPVTFVSSNFSLFPTTIAPTVIFLSWKFDNWVGYSKTLEWINLMNFMHSQYFNSDLTKPVEANKFLEKRIERCTAFQWLDKPLKFLTHPNFAGSPINFQNPQKNP